ncbi:MAG: rod shape-determining protein MreD [Spirochaetaceae bacterium]|jgi:rod shape-determining protein MreD|nr:rod shape-determining protein MreD [Spirochaetaceae bacterium]
MVKNIVWSTIFATIAALLQSVLLYRLKFYGAVPDLSLGVLVFSAYVNGTMNGQLTGFFSGIFYDFLSVAPMGLYTFIRTIIGALTGLLRGTFFLDTLVLPMVLCASATIFKGLMLFGLHLLFAGAVPSYPPLTSPVFWFELLLNTITAPFLFWLLKLFKPLLASPGEN